MVTMAWGRWRLDLHTKLPNPLFHSVYIFQSLTPVLTSMSHPGYPRHITYILSKGIYILEYLMNICIHSNLKTWISFPLFLSIIPNIQLPAQKRDALSDKQLFIRRTIFWCIGNGKRTQKIVGESIVKWWHCMVTLVIKPHTVCWNFIFLRIWWLLSRPTTKSEK